MGSIGRPIAADRTIHQLVTLRIQFDVTWFGLFTEFFVLAVGAISSDGFVVSKRDQDAGNSRIARTDTHAAAPSSPRRSSATTTTSFNYMRYVYKKNRRVAIIP